MEYGAVTQQIDVGQIAITLFGLFFVGLVIYLRREDRREGWPLVSDLPGRVTQTQDAFLPTPKEFILPHGGAVYAPGKEPPQREVAAVPTGNWPGAPLEPTGNPMIDGVGPAAWADREDVPERTFLTGEARILPLRLAHEMQVETQGIDPRGFEVVGADGVVAGTVEDLWVDVPDTAVRFLEVQAGPRRVLVPTGFTVFKASKRQVVVKAILASQFANVPALRSMDQITKLEDEKVCAYFGGGHLYATPERAEPLL